MSYSAIVFLVFVTSCGLAQAQTKNNQTGGFSCQPNDSGLCSCVNNLAEPVSGLDSSLPGEFLVECPFCATGNVTAPLSECSPDCVLWSVELNGTCSRCALLESGDFACDCSNLFPDVDCPQRDPSGACTDEHCHWRCIPQGLGYVCYEEAVVGGDSKNPAFQFDEIPGSNVILHCETDISGGTAEQCANPICRIDNTGKDFCNSCELLLPFGNFTYDCSNVYPNMTCPILKADGTCEDASPLTMAPTPVVPEDRTTTPTEDDRESGWILYGISARGFNVLSDIFAYTTRVLFGVAFSALCPVFMTWHVKQGKPIPINRLGSVPGDVFQATGSLQFLRWSLASLLVAGIMLVADFSHSVADVGLDFVAVKGRGPDQPVLVIAPDKRNKGRPIQTAGDPLTIRTYQQPIMGDLEEKRSQNSLVLGYIDAATKIGTDASPFITRASDAAQVFTHIDRVPDFRVDFMSDDSALEQMDTRIPLECESVNLIEIEQSTVNDHVFEKPLKTTALVPNCTFASTRPSGIYDTSPKTIQIIEIAARLTADPILDASLDIWLRNSSNKFRVFEATAESRRLARDREDWKKGREFFGIDGVEIGDLSIDFGAVVVATGTSKAPYLGDGQTEYGFVAEITSDCPRRPSGLPTSDDVECFAILTAVCDTFPEDSAKAFHEVYFPQPTSTSQCTLNSIWFVWGRNFVADAELVAVVAGMYGIIQPILLEKYSFVGLGVLAALFALGTLEGLPSNENFIRPKVNGVYIVFMLLPLFLSIVSVIVVVSFRKRQDLPIPETPLQLMVTATETESSYIPKRSSRNNKFPDDEKKLVFVRDLGIVPTKVHLERLAGTQHLSSTTAASSGGAIEQYEI